MYFFLIILFSLICGIVTKDMLGIFIIGIGLLNAYYSSEGKIINYVFGGIYSLINGYVYFINGLFGTAFLSLFLYLPLQVYGYINWNKNKIDNNKVKVRGFDLKKSIYVTCICILGSLVFGFILYNIPNQQLAFLDSSSNCLNICAIILMNYRYRECWYIWLFNNIFDLSIWVINVIKGSPNSVVMLIISIGYLIFNLYGVVMWHKMLRENKKQVNG